MSKDKPNQLELEATTDLLTELARRSAGMVFSGMTPDGARACIQRWGPDTPGQSGIQVAICGDLDSILSLTSCIIPQVAFQIRRRICRGAADQFVTKALLATSIMWDQLRNEEGDGPIAEEFEGAFEPH